MNLPQETTAPATAATFHNVTMVVNVTKDGTRVFSHFLDYGLPTLDMVNPALPAPDSWKEEEVKEGDKSAIISSPVYNDTKLDYVQSALVSKMQGLARSRDKANQAPVMTWEELAECGTGSKYPVQLKQFRADFYAWLKEDSDASDAQADALLRYTDTKLLMEQAHSRKESIAKWFTQFLEAYGEKASEVTNVINNINAALATDLEEVDL